MAYEIIETLKREIAGFRDDPKFAAVGIVTEAGDGIARITGLSAAVSQELLIVETEAGDITALAANLETGAIGAMILGDSSAVKIGDRVRSTGTVLSIPAGNELFGRVIDPLGRPVDGKGVIFKDPARAKNCLIERPAPSVVARESVSTPVHTGIKAIDAMIPIGRGQRELIIGDRQTGKTALAIDTILNQMQDQVGKRLVCIYVAIGQKNSKIAKIVRLLEERGALHYTIVVSAPASAPVSLQYLAPFAGCAIGEYFMDKGDDALVIYDDLSKHADAYRQISLLLRRPPGREAYPGDIFYLHSRLLERAAKLNQAHGGGSLTALPIIETKLGDVAAYIPTNVISITDGQIYLESSLFHRGIRPAVNVGLSVSRVGSAAQTKAMRKVASRLRLELAQFRELAAFAQFASDLDDATRQRLKRGELLTELLTQPDGFPVPFERQVAILFASLQGQLDDIPREEVRAFETGLLAYLDKLHEKDVLTPIREHGDLTDKTEAVLRKAVDEYRRTRAVQY